MTRGKKPVPRPTSPRLVRAVIAAAVGGMLVILLVAARAPWSSPTPTRAVGDIAARGTAAGRSARGALPRAVAQARPAVGEAVAEEAGVVAPSVDGVTFADHFATDICRCADAACAAQVNETYTRQLGTVLPERDAAAQYGAFARASACQAALAPAAPEE